MTNDQFRICIVDDEEFCCMVASAALKDAGFRPAVCSSGEACLALYDSGDNPPDLLLLDIELGGIDGYEVCRRIRAAGHDDVQIIFVSGHNDLDSRLASFDAGGNDFITKPLLPEELVRKVILAIRSRQSVLELKRDKTAAEEMSNLALTSLDEMGAIQKFLRSLLGCRTLETLGRLVISTLAPYGCNSVVQLRTAQETRTLTREGSATPLEESILDQSKQMERLFQFRSRMIVNYERISILVTNMPLADEVLAGRIRDYAAVIAEAADAAMESIAVRMDVVARANELQELARASRDSVTTLREQYRSQQTETRRELDGMADNVESMYYKLGLSPHQEMMISDIVRTSVSRVLDLFAIGLLFEDQFEQILSSLEKASNILVEKEKAEVVSTEVWL